MEYNIRIELQDDHGTTLAATTMTERQAQAIRLVHNVDVLLDTVEIMKMGAISPLEIERIRSVDPNEAYCGINARRELGALMQEMRNTEELENAIEKFDRQLNEMADDQPQIPEGIMQRAPLLNMGGTICGDLNLSDEPLSNVMDEINLSLEVEGDVTTGTFEDPTSGLLHAMQEAIDKRRNEPQDEFWPWMEANVPVTKEDVQDYMTYFGVNSETAYERIKKYAMGETKEIEAEHHNKDLTAARVPLTPEQIAQLWINPERK